MFPFLPFTTPSTYRNHIFREFTLSNSSLDAYPILLRISDYGLFPLHMLVSYSFHFINLVVSFRIIGGVMAHASNEWSQFDISSIIISFFSSLWWSHRFHLFLHLRSSHSCDSGCDGRIECIPPCIEITLVWDEMGGDGRVKDALQGWIPI